MDARLWIQCRWDRDAEVWYVEGSNVPGLVTEAATTDEMVANLREIIPELLELNKVQPDYGTEDASVSFALAH